jgi:hypothetical protein
VFNIDERIRGLPAQREQVVALLQSINAPHLAIPGKQAGPAQAYILGLRGTAGFGVFVYLYLAEVGDCAVYISDNRNLSAEQYEEEEADAMGFVESMGFMMDNTNFRGLPASAQDELLKTLPLFQKDPRKAAPQAASRGAAKPGAGAPQQKSSIAALGRLFSSF